MTEDDNFQLRWNHFDRHLYSEFHDTLCRGDLVDVTLAAEGKLFKVHRFVLSICSTYFREMLREIPPNYQAYIYLKDVSESILQQLIQFMYCGEVNLEKDDLPLFVSTAQALQIKALIESEEGGPVQTTISTRTCEYDLIHQGGKKLSSGQKTSTQIILQRSQKDQDYITQDVPITSMPADYDSSFVQENTQLCDSDMELEESEGSEFDDSGINKHHEENTTTKSPAATNKRFKPVPNISSFPIAEFVPGTQFLYYEGFEFRRNGRTVNNSTRRYWMCKTYRSTGCKGKLITIKDADGVERIITPSCEHKHIRKLVQHKKVPRKPQHRRKHQEQKLHHKIIRNDKIHTTNLTSLPRPQFKMGQHGNQLLVHEGFEFRKNGKSPIGSSKKYWLCQLSSRTMCRARLITDLDENGEERIVSKAWEHCHTKNKEKTEEDLQTSQNDLGDLQAVQKDILKESAINKQEPDTNPEEPEINEEVSEINQEVSEINQEVSEKNQEVSEINKEVPVISPEEKEINPNGKEINQEDPQSNQEVGNLEADSEENNKSEVPRQLPAVEDDFDSSDSEDNWERKEVKKRKKPTSKKRGKPFKIVPNIAALPKAQYIRGLSAKSKLVSYEGSVFRRNGRSLSGSSRIYWMCQMAKKTGCPARLVTIPDENGEDRIIPPQFAHQHTKKKLKILIGN